METVNKRQTIISLAIKTLTAKEKSVNNHPLEKNIMN